MIAKKGKQIMINNFNNFNIVSGTVDNKNAKSIYLTISGWADPLISKDVNYKKVIKEFNKTIKNRLFNTLDKHLFNVNRSIVDFDMRESGLTYGKRSYMNCEITLFQNHKFKIQEKVIQDSLNNILNEIITSVLNESKFFKFYKVKK